MSPEHNLTGQEFNDWTVLRYAGRKNRASMWLCRCKCGREREISAGNLRRRLSKRCRTCAANRQTASITFQGRTRTKPEWAQHLGLSLSGLNLRLRHYPVNVALRKKLPKPRNQPQGRLLTFKGTTLSLSAWARRLGLSKRCLQKRLTKMSVEQALAMPVSKKRKQAGRKARLSRTKTRKDQ